MEYLCRVFIANGGCLLFVCLLFPDFSLTPFGAHWLSLSPYNPWWQGSWGQHEAHLGPKGPRWAPCWPHELCYLGCVATVCHQVRCMHWGHFSHFHRAGRFFIWYECSGWDINYTVLSGWNSLISFVRFAIRSTETPYWRIRGFSTESFCFLCPWISNMSSDSSENI